LNEKLAQCFDEMLEEQSTGAEAKKKEKLSDRDLAQNVNDKLSDRFDESLSDRDKEEDVNNDDRDPGVSDDDWRELELAKIKAQNQEEIRRKIFDKEKK
jgi:hypothetical protein